MQIAREPEVPVAVTREAARGGQLEVKCLRLGDPRITEKLGSQYARNSSDPASPRHRHDFEHIRIRLRGAITQ